MAATPIDLATAENEEIKIRNKNEGSA